ncbi:MULTISPECIES: hypothetical protein [unclassified Salmonella]|uniref:hypothetical protein n=1 Tax=unclassified Salmonella TaxID=2614656 RepID=UPI003F68431C
MTTNHPAHGPVSLERLHQISEILSKAAAQSDGGNLGYAMADAVKVIDGAITAFGAEPVAEIKISRGGYDKGEKIIDYYSEEIQHLTDGQKLYTSPPAPPAPVVPDEIKHRIGGLDWGWEGEFNRGWNACRSAMLKAGNSPVIPESSTCKYCGGTGYFRWQQSENMCPCPCVGCDQSTAPKQENV